MEGQLPASENKIVGVSLAFSFLVSIIIAEKFPRRNQICQLTAGSARTSSALKVGQKKTPEESGVE